MDNRVSGCSAGHINKLTDRSPRRETEIRPDLVLGVSHNKKLAIKPKKKRDY